MKSLLSSKIVIVFLALFVVFMAQLKFKQFRQEQAIQKVKNELLRQESQELEKNKQLTQSLQMLESSDFKEKIVRGQLNMKKEGELVFNFTEAPQADSSFGSNRPEQISNPEKWWNYFFYSRP